MRPRSMACSASHDGDAARKQADSVEARDVENLRRGPVGAAADVIDVGDNEDGEDGRLADDEREHGHACRATAGASFRPRRWEWCSSLVLPVRIVRMFEIPQRAPAAYDRIFSEVVRRRRRGRRPLERPRIPRVVAGHAAVQVRVDHVPRQRSAPRLPGSIHPPKSRMLSVFHPRSGS